MLLPDLLILKTFSPYLTLPVTILYVSIRSPRIRLSPRVVKFINSSRLLYGNSPTLLASLVNLRWMDSSSKIIDQLPWQAAGFHNWTQYSSLGRIIVF